MIEIPPNGSNGDQAHDGFRPSLVSWNLTRLCNLKCPHCYLSAGKKAESCSATDRSFMRPENNRLRAAPRR